MDCTEESLSLYVILTLARLDISSSLTPQLQFPKIADILLTKWGVCVCVYYIAIKRTIEADVRVHCCCSRDINNAV